MAQIINYFSDDVTYEEGPFVCCCVAGKYRVEVELKGHHYPVLPHYSIYEYYNVWINVRNIHVVLTHLVFDNQKYPTFMTSNSIKKARHIVVQDSI